MSAFLLSAGEKGKRFALPNSRIMIHQPLISGGLGGQASLWRVAHPEEIVIHQDCLSLIESLQAQYVPIALLSDNPAASQWQKIARLPDHIAFSTIVLTDVFSAPKPDCRGFLKVAEDLNMPPESMILALGLATVNWRQTSKIGRAHV